MAILHDYKCHKCGFRILSSKDGDYSLLSGPGHFYKCTECNHVFTKNWIYKDIYLSANNVKCILCNGNAELWNPSKGCPICGNVLEKTG